MSEWADAYRVLPETSPEPGRWRTDRAPYLRGIMDAASDARVEQIVWQKAAQVGGSEILLNLIGYHIHQDPAPILLVQISTGEAAKFSKERVAPMIAATPVLAERVAPAKSRDSDNTIESKRFPGGHLGIVGANAPSGLRSRPRRVILFDEVDGYPASAGAEGDPVELAARRASNYWNRLIVMISTPTVAEVSRIEEAMRHVDEVRRYWVPCPHCRGMQVLEWGGPDADYGIKWEGRDPETAAYLCRHCHSLIDHHHKLWMLRDAKAGGLAEWRAEVAHPSPRSVGFHLSALYSPWVPWSVLVREFLDAQGNPLRLQVWRNTRMAEVWDDRGTSLDEHALLTRAREEGGYSIDPLPEGVVLVTAGVDVHADRLEVAIVGWGVGEESWGLEYVRIPADPTVPTWHKDLDDVLIGRRYRHPSGELLPIAATCVDSQYATQHVLRYCRDRQAARIWAVLGVAGEGRPIMGRPGDRNREKVPKFPVGVDTAKGVIYSRLLISEPGPGYVHFPLGRGFDEEFFRQLTGEKLVLRDTRLGRLRREWQVKRGRQNHALDCWVYATAALESLLLAGVRLEQLAERMRAQPEAEQTDEVIYRRRGGWVRDW